MRVLATARHPGAAEAVGPVVDSLRSAGHEVLLIGVSNVAPENKTLGGSASIFERAGTEFIEFFDSDPGHGVTDVPGHYASGLVDSFAPDRVLVGCSSSENLTGPAIEEAFVVAGVGASIPTVQVVESWGVWRRVPGTPAPSIWAALDSITVTVMSTAGALSDRIAITGHPGLDSYADAETPRSSKFRTYLGVEGYRAILFFGQTADSNMARKPFEALEWVLDSLGPKDRLILARHPRDTQDYRTLRERAEGRMIEPGIDSHRLLSVADVCVSQYSTMGLKSALLGIPTISITHPDDFPEIREAAGGIPLCVTGGSTEVQTPHTLRQLLQGDVAAGASTLKAAINVDGNATRRVMDLVIRDGL
ncbi:MAG: hypothetical protein OTJ97_05320 [SAR202 cluster bacterium]|nr:hypothetical protein [SAR202 cluster bacterium]